MKSLTGRTVVKASVDDYGAFTVKVFRSGQCVHDFSGGREQDIPGATTLVVNDGAVDVVDDRGIVVKSIPIE